MFKTGIFLLYGALTHYIIAMFWAQFLWLRKLEVMKTVTGDALEHMPPQFWNVFIIEILLSAILIFANPIKRFWKNLMKKINEK